MDGKSLSAFFAEQYLKPYVSQGASSVKVIVAEQGSRQEFATSLSKAAVELGMKTAIVDSSRARLHLVQQLFFEVARQIDWLDVAQHQLNQIVDRCGLARPSQATYTLRELATYNELEPGQARLEVLKETRRSILQSGSYTRLFKHAILGLLAGALDRNGSGAFGASQIISWLRGESLDMRALRQLHIARRINRQNARALLLDASRWIHNAGCGGLVAVIDGSLYCDLDETRSHRAYAYPPAAAIDFFEVIRQFIDWADSAAGLFLAFVFGRGFVDDRRRGMTSYLALKMRLADEVYDTEHPNLMAPLASIREW